MVKKSIAKKYQALEDFKNRLLNSEVRDLIAKIILFGSLTDGRADEDSDVDLMVFALRDSKKVEEACDWGSYETCMKFGQSVEPLIYLIDELRYTNSILVEKAKRFGKEIYSMSKNEIRLREAENYFTLAEEFLDYAQRNLRIKLYRVAVDVAYNSIELCLKGLILLKAETLPKRHGGLVQRFGKLYVEPGIVNKQFARELKRALRLRNRARYEFDVDITKENAQETVKLATEAVEILKMRFAGI